MSVNQLAVFPRMTTVIVLQAVGRLSVVDCSGVLLVVLFSGDVLCGGTARCGGH